MTFLVKKVKTSAKPQLSQEKYAFNSLKAGKKTRAHNKTKVIIIRCIKYINAK
jgi:hypothetical protein